ncbi:glutathione S-transferase C-terminal domain-containing protein isoform X1 [Hyla sarda]|uniref:glutathione S-transferase C-terminal domain-containing protein isoform X1 n=1 Tax=Hyla sarda TaxID=327740 RepID=UPI0024C29D7C|nr:glutathione S-transferase C-terminal domain-containing protein isoform X1 [Hyla sarda]XP_056422060.1 glutathione S-transferase C-terminal domain-containing protein isoform X1 [Hyla sarda]
MKNTESSKDTEEELFLDIDLHHGDTILPLHTSIVLFLMSYCDCKTFKTFLVVPEEGHKIPKEGFLPSNLVVSIISRKDLPGIVQSCRLPAVIEASGVFCRAGLAVVLRHIIQKTYSADPSRKDVLELLGFKKTCLKACAEVSQWTRLCEISIPWAVETFLKDPSATIPPEVLQLERKLGEPVRVHNDDKIRRQKMQEMKSNENGKRKEAQKETTQNNFQKPPSLELTAALSRLSVQDPPIKTAREPAHIRKAKTSDLPSLEHVFAEGLYFTLTDVVLLPCIHHFLVALQKVSPEKIYGHPLIIGWYQRVLQVQGVQKAAAASNIKFLHFLPVDSQHQEHSTASSIEEEEKEIPEIHFLGGPRPTMTKLKDHGIEAAFAPHPCPSQAIDWGSLPAEVRPAEGKMSSDRALRKQQQLNNILSVVTNMAKPSDTIVDFCSGGGHVGIVLAYMLPSCQIILIENKEESLIRARDRSNGLGLTNIWFIQANLDYFTGEFNIGVALHACGVATDMVIEHCIAARAAFVICPCCYGFIQNTVKTTFPRSCRFQNVLSYKEHMVLCRFADQTAVQLPAERRQIGKNCMGLVDLDRAWAAEQHGYKAHVISMEPESCSPKNNLIVGCLN